MHSPSVIVTDHDPQPSFVRAIPRRHPALPRSPEEAQYLEMESAFLASGGIVSCDDVAERLRVRVDQPISLLARWIVAHQVLSFGWRSRTLLPLFQFDVASMTLRPEVADVVGELVPALPEWEAALWFARPNRWLNHAAPVDMIAVDARAVYDAARAHRFADRAA